MTSKCAVPDRMLVLLGAGNARARREMNNEKNHCHLRGRSPVSDSKRRARSRTPSSRNVCEVDGGRRGCSLRCPPFFSDSTNCPPLTAPTAPDASAYARSGGTSPRTSRRTCIAMSADCWMSGRCSGGVSWWSYEFAAPKTVLFPARRKAAIPREMTHKKADEAVHIFWQSYTAQHSRYALTAMT